MGSIMSGKMKDHWNSLASLLGMGGKTEKEEAPPASAETATPEASLVMGAEEATSQAVPQTPPAPPPPAPRPAPRREAARKPKPAPQSAPKRRDHWGGVLGQLGLEAPPPEPEPEPEPVRPPPRQAAPPSPPEAIPTRPAKAELQASEVEDEAPEGPPGYQGPDLEERLHAERDRPARSRPERGDRARPSPPRRMEDEVQFDDDLDSGLREMWAIHESASSALEDVADLEDIELDEEPEELDEELPELDKPPRAEPEREELPRKRRRRGRRRGRRPREEDAVPSAAPAESELLDDGDDTAMADEEEAGVEPPRRAAVDRDEEEPPRGKRRRRRRRKPETAQAAAVEADDALDDEDFEGPASVDYLDDAEKGESHKRIPTWDDAIGAIVSANMESRNRHPSPRGRDGRGRRG